MIAFILGILLLTLYIFIKNENKPVDFIGFFGILFIIWGTSRYVGASPKPIWDPN